MIEKLTLLFAKKTGHVLALLTRAADPEAAVKPDELTAQALPVRYVGDTTRSWIRLVRFFVPVDELDAQTVDFDELVLNNPLGYFLDADKNVQALDQTLRVTGVTSPAGHTQVQVTINTPATADANVLIHVTDGNLELTLSGKITSGANFVNINVGQTLAAGTYYALTLVAGLPPNSYDFTVT